MPETEGKKNGVSKCSIGYFKMENETGERATSCIATANREDGGIRSHATQGKGTQGEKHWIVKRMAKDIDNSCERHASANKRG